MLKLCFRSLYRPESKKIISQAVNDSVAVLSITPFKFGGARWLIDQLDMSAWARASVWRHDHGLDPTVNTQTIDRRDIFRHWQIQREGSESIHQLQTATGHWQHDGRQAG